MAFRSDDEIRLEIIIEAKRALAALKRVEQAADKVSASANRIEKASKVATSQIDKGMKQSTKSAQGLNNVLRLIRGTLVAIGVFRVFQFIEETARKAVESVKQLELSMIKLESAEKALSKSGVDITMQDLLDITAELVELFPYISDIDAQKSVAQVALLTKELKLSKEQIQDLATDIPILARRAEVSIDSATQQIITGLTTSGRGWKDLGIQVDAEIIRQEAVRQKLVESEDAYRKLSGEQKQQIEVLALIGLLNTSVVDELEKVNDSSVTLFDTTKELSAEWENLSTLFGQVLKPVLVALTQALTIYIQIWKSGFTIIGVAFTEFSTLVFGGMQVINDAFKGNIKSLDDLKAAYQDVREVAYKAIFPTGVPDIEIGTSVTGQFGIGLGSILGIDELITYEDTATESAENLENALLNITEIEGFDKFIDDITKLQQKLKETQEDFDLDQAREFEDYQLDIARIQQDFQIKRERVIQDANQAIEDANRKHREREKNDEARFQEELRQLREKFLFNLEDALRERDARQVLRLQRQYEMDKTALTNEYELRQQQQDQQHTDDIARIKRERDERLAELAQEEAIRLQREREDFELKQARAQQDHEIEMERLRAQLSERLMEFAEALGEEYDLNNEAVQQLYNLLQEYYGPGGKFDDLYNYSAQSIVSNAQGILDVLNQLIGQASEIASFGMSAASNIVAAGGISRSGIRGSTGAIPFIGGQASGGTYLATKPTAAIFGETPEIASFIPVNKLRAGMGAGASPMGGAGGGGMLQVMVDLSPDLEARVVNKSLDNVSSVIRTVRNQR